MTDKEKGTGPNPGYGALFKNDYKEEEAHPDFRGKIALTPDLIDAAENDGVLELSAWKKSAKNGSYLSISIKEVYKKGEKKASKKKPVDDDLLDDDL